MSIFTDGLTHAWAMFSRTQSSSNLVETDEPFQLSLEPRALSPNTSIPGRSFSRSSIASMIFNRIAMDAASSEWKTGKVGEYKLPKAGTVYSSEQLIEHWKSLVEKYPIISISQA